MKPIRLKVEVSTDLDGIRAMFLRMGPQLEKRQPGITVALQQADLSQPMKVAGKRGEVTTVQFEPEGLVTVIKVEVRPPAGVMGAWRGRWWGWRTRVMVKLALKMAKKMAGKPAPPAST